MLLFESLKDVSQETSTYSKLATEIPKQDYVSLLTTCYMSKSSVKSFLVYYEHFFVYCDAFVFKIIFFYLFIVNFKQISPLDLPFLLSALDIY